MTDRAAFDRAPFDAKEKLESCLFTPNQCPALPVAITIPQASDVQMRKSILLVNLNYSLFAIFLVTLVGSVFAEAPGMQPMADRRWIRT